MNKYFKKLLFFIALFSIVSAVCLAESVIRTEHFEVVHEGVGKHYADIAARSAERSFNLISGNLGHKPAETISIILTRSGEQFRELTRGALPDWSAAVALPGNRIIITPLKGQKITLEHIIAHEIVHCIIDDAAGEVFVPRWFHEGCAQTLSGRWGIRGRMYMVWKVVSGNLLTFSDIQRIFSSGSTDAALAYDQSMLAVKQLIRIHGGNVLIDIIGGIKSGYDFPEAFRNATGILPEEFEMEYISYLKKAYGRRSLITLVPGTWTAILMLAALVYVVKKYRNRRLLRQWEEAERAGNIIDFHRFPPDDY